MHPMRDYPSDEYRIEGRVFREMYARLTQTFFSDVHQQTGFYRFRGLLWHAFSYGYQTALDRNSAKLAFAECDDAELYVHDEQLDRLWCCPRAIAISSTHPCNDTYIFPATYDWLYITTHENESGIGPYFVRQPSLIN